MAGRAASPPRAVRRRPASEEIAAYHRDANTYFALLVFYGVAKCIDTAPPSVALALQRFLCAILEGYGDSHPVRTRYENAMPCFFYTKVEGMPPHTNDAEMVVRNGPKRYMDAHVQFKSFRGMAVAARTMEISANARNNVMPVGRAVTYAVATLNGAYSTGRRPTRWRGCPRAGRGGG